MTGRNFPDTMLSRETWTKRYIQCDSIYIVDEKLASLRKKVLLEPNRIINWEQPKNWCFWTVVLEKTLESPLDCNARRSNQSILKEILGPGSWVFIGRTDAEAETPVLWPLHVKSWLIGKDWCWEGLGAGGKGDDGGWDGWMASLTRWMWVWVNSGRWWWTGRPGVLQFMGSQRVGHDWATELNWTEDFSTC